jgi:hypothetical protein
VANAKINVNDALFPWWTTLSSFDGKQDAVARELKFLNYVQHSGDKFPIFVGHSLFFRHFYSRRVSVKSLSAKGRPNLAQELKKYKLSNCTVLALTIEFGEDCSVGGGLLPQFLAQASNVASNGSSTRIRKKSRIIDAELIFGNGMHVSSKDSSSRRGSRASDLEGNSNGDEFDFYDSEDESDNVQSGMKDNSSSSAGVNATPRQLHRYNSKSGPSLISHSISRGIEDTMNKLSGKLEDVTNDMKSQLNTQLNHFGSMFGLGSASRDTYER